MIRAVRPRTASTLAAFILLFSGSAAAQQSEQRGRTANGKAYRIENGMRLTDHLAELEVSNEELKRQLLTVEDELIDLQKQLGKTEKSVSRPAPLPPAATSDPAVPALTAEVQTLRGQVASLNGQLQQSKAAARCNYESPENPYQRQVQELQRTLSASSAASNGQVVAERERCNTAEAALTSLREKLDEQMAKTAQLEQELSAAKTSLSAAREESNTSRAALSRPDEITPVKTTEVSSEDVVAAKKDLRDELTKIQSLIIERKNLLDSVKGKGRGVSVSLQPLVTKDHKSLDTLRAEVHTLNEASAVAPLRGGLNQITEILNEDVSVLRRLSGR